MGLFNDSLPTRRNNSLRNFFDFSFEDLSGKSPLVEIQDKEKSYCVRAEIPGMQEKDLNISLKDNMLVLEGERKSEHTKEDEHSFSSEFSYGKFYRTIPFKDQVDPETVKATYHNGILEVELDKIYSTPREGKKIAINEKKIN